MFNNKIKIIVHAPPYCCIHLVIFFVAFILYLSCIYQLDCQSCELDLSESLEIPPDYTPAKNFPVCVVNIDSNQSTVEPLSIKGPL